MVFPIPILIPAKFLRISRKQAGAELCQAQVKLEVIVQVVEEAVI